jgi:predicted phosphohydrolase
MRIVTLSDTHGMHDRVQLPDGDILIHAGDFMNGGLDVKEARRFFEWFEEQPHRHKVVIGGNHDVYFDTHSSIARRLVPTNIHYLEDSGLELEGLKFWGSPVTPRFGIGWGFNRDRGFAINQHWRMIPEDTDVLITHGPPQGFLDQIYEGEPGVGCEELRKAVDRIKPKYHIFGHIHAGYGVEMPGETMFVNAAICNEQYRPINQPIVIDLQ